MSRIVHDFREPERFIVGTVGQPGERAFFLQAAADGYVITLALEKQHAQALGESIETMLDELGERYPALNLPPAAEELEDAEPLEMPVDPEFPLGAIALNWKPDDALVVIDLVAASETTITEAELLDERNTEHDVIRIRLSPHAARQFALRARRVVAAGRAHCPLCEEPINPAGHLCIRLNGYKRRSPADLSALLDNQ